MILPIYLYGQAALRKPTEEIEQGEIDVKKLVSDMQEKMGCACMWVPMKTYTSLGIGFTIV